jgi:hypothetical protein
MRRMDFSPCHSFFAGRAIGTSPGTRALPAALERA